VSVVAFRRPTLVAGRLVYESAGHRRLRGLLKARDERGRRVWTLERLAKKAGVSVNAIHSLACGVTKEPSLHLARALHALGVDWESWFDASFPINGKESSSE
jgi:transcriptional regulator with XRE-family HTH domain